MKDAFYRARYQMSQTPITLSVTNRDDPSYLAADHNPANFNVRIPNVANYLWCKKFSHRFLKPSVTTTIPPCRWYHQCFINFFYELGLCKNTFFCNVKKIKRLTQEKKFIIQALGFSFRHIANCVGCDAKTVRVSTRNKRNLFIIW